MSALTFGNVTTIAEALLNASGDLNWSATDKQTLANLANREVWDLLVSANPSWVASRTSFTWASGTERVDLTGASYLNAEPKLILDVYETPSNSTPSQTNSAWPWTPVEHARRHRKNAYPRGSYGRRYGCPGRQSYSISGNFMYATPVPSSARYLHIEWVPQVTARVNDSTEVLSGQAEHMGDVVALRLADLMNAKDNHNPAIKQMWLEAKERIITEAANRQVQRNHVVGARGWS